MFIIIYGNPIDGLHFVGPFDDQDEAQKYAELNITTEDWWIGDLEAAETDLAIQPE